MVFHHDDPPCEARLNSDHTCSLCGIHPDTQSKCIWPYCPECDIPLKRMECPECHKKFKK